MRSRVVGVRSTIVWCFLAVLLGSCQWLYPEPDPTEDTGAKGDEPLFPAAYYAQNAKEYFDDGHYARAREQWNTQLKLEPDRWMVRLAIASCDYYLGSTALDRRDFKTGRELLARAETEARELWNGELEKDTVDTVTAP